MYAHELADDLNREVEYCSIVGSGHICLLQHVQCGLAMKMAVYNRWEATNWSKSLFWRRRFSKRREHADVYVPFRGEFSVPRS